MIRYATVTACAAALVLSACSKAEETPAAPAEAAPIPAEAPAAAASAAHVTPEAAAFAASLSPMELAQARLSCVHPLTTAKANAKVFPADVAALLEGAPDIERTPLLSSEPLNSLTTDQARFIMDMGPKFNPQSKPTDDEIQGVKQCVMLAHHYAAERAAG